MGLRNLLICTLILATASAQSLDDPWFRDPLVVGLWKLSTAINFFGFNLFEDLTISEGGNVLICPYSLSISLGILHYGSTGETEKELADVLGYTALNLTKEEAAQVFYMLSTKQLKSANPKFYLFDAPSTILINRNNGVLPTFQRMVEVLFQAPLTVVGFVESAEDLTRSVNDWIAARTKNKIQHILEFVDPFSDMIVLNAAYFKGSWIHKFPPQDTTTGYFYNYGLTSESKQVPMMQMKRSLNYYRDQHHSVLEFPFRGRNVSMIILLPEKIDGIDELNSKFSLEFLEDQIWQMGETNLKIAFPKFKIKFGADLTRNLRGLGVETLFHPEKVDLSGMVRRDSVTFGEFRHQTTISVAENGVDAPAIVSANPYLRVPEIPDFVVNHPFLFVIYERKIKMILLVGCVREL